MKYRNDHFAIYRWKEYRLGVGKEHNLRLYSEDPADLLMGFDKIGNCLFSLSVKKEDLSSFYSINTLVSYKGNTFGIVTVKGDKVLITTGAEGWSRQFIEMMGLEQVDLGVYEKWVNEKDLDKVWEEKSSIKI